MAENENQPIDIDEPKTLEGFIVKAIYTAAAVAQEMHEVLSVLSDEEAERLGTFIAEETARTAGKAYREAVFDGKAQGLL